MYAIRILMIITALGMSLCATAQFSRNEDQQIVIGTVDTLFSVAQNDQREIWVHVPENMDTAQKYPVIYLLDAPAHFFTATGLLKLLTEWNMPPSILVGINTSDSRIRDLTPIHVPFHRGHQSETSGGAPDFARFIKTELQPYIKDKYPVEDINTIIGHSTGGLFVIYSYVHHPDIFDNYLAIEPSLWWDQETLVKQAEKLINKDDYQNKHLYIAVANGEDMDTVSVRTDTTEATEQIRANLNFHDILVKNESYLDFTWDYYGNESHGSIVVPGMYNGLRTLFSWYPFEERWRFNTPEQYTVEELIQPYYLHFSELSKRFKHEIKPDWQFVNDVGFFMLSGHNLPKKAHAYLEMNVKYYPHKSESYVALGNFYLMQDNKEDAIKYFEKAIEIDGNAEARTKVNKLK